MGFADARVSVGGPDRGIDVRASGAVAQVKRWRAKVSRPELQKLFGARGKDDSSKLLFFAASSGYTKGAIEYADSVEMSLFIYESDGTVVGANDFADELIAVQAEAAARATAALAAAATAASAIAAARQTRMLLGLAPDSVSFRDVSSTPSVHPVERAARRGSGIKGWVLASGAPR